MGPEVQLGQKSVFQENKDAGSRTLHIASGWVWNVLQIPPM